MAEIIGGDAAVVDDTSTAVVDDAAVVDDQSSGTDAGVDDSTQDADDASSGDSVVDGDGAAATGAGPERFKGLIESLKKTDPALAKEIKTLVFAADALKKEIPGGLPEIRQMKTTIDELGGADGIESIKAEKAEWAQIDGKFAAGDASVLDKFAEFNKEGFAKLIPAAIDKLAAVDREAYNHALSGIFVSTLDSWKFTDSIERMAENLARIVDDKGNQLCANEIKLLGRMAQQYDSIKELATKAPTKKLDAESDKLKQERATLASERAQLTTDHVSNATSAYATKKYSEFIPVEARNQKLDVEALKKTEYGEGDGTAYDRFTREIDSEVARMIGADQSLVKKVKDSISAGRRDEATKLSNSKFDAVYQQAVRRVIGRWAKTFNPKGATGKTNGNGTGKNGTPPPPAGVKQLTDPPDTNLIDKSDPNWHQNYMMYSKAKLKTGQRVQW